MTGEQFIVVFAGAFIGSQGRSPDCLFKLLNGINLETIIEVNQTVTILHPLREVMNLIHQFFWIIFVGFLPPRFQRRDAISGLHPFTRRGVFHRRDTPCRCKRDPAII